MKVIVLFLFLTLCASGPCGGRKKERSPLGRDNHQRVVESLPSPNINKVIDVEHNLKEIQQLPSPYNELTRVLPPLLKYNWFHKHEDIMIKLIKEYQPKVVIELGSWLGSSAIFISKSIDENSRLYAVDHWLGSVEHHQNREWKQLLPTLYDQFLSNVINAGLSNKVIPIRKSTLEAVSYFQQDKIQPDIVYVDAAHDEVSVYNDIKAYWPLVKNAICGDDWDWLTVRKAVERFSEEYKLKIEVVRTMWIFRK